MDNMHSLKQEYSNALTDEMEQRVLVDSLHNQYSNIVKRIKRETEILSDMEKETYHLSLVIKEMEEKMKNYNIVWRVKDDENSKSVLLNLEIYGKQCTNILDGLLMLNGKKITK